MTCFNCGVGIPEGARFCPACGAPVSTPAPGGFPAGRVADFDGSVWELCRVEWWRGYVKSDFVARPLGGSGEVARSPLFPWRKGGVPQEEGKALAAYEELVRALVEDGWQPVGKPRPWYAQTFRRPVLSFDAFASERGPIARTEPTAERGD